MPHLYSSYIDSIVFDSIVESKPSDMETEANLALWTNAQFTFDVQPGSGILEDNKSSSSSSPETTATTMSSPSITYESLANYLDYELPQQQQQQQHQQQLMQIQALQQQQQLAATTTATPRAHHQQLLLPKIVPAMTLEEITKALLSTTNTYNTSLSASITSIASPITLSKAAAVPMDITMTNKTNEKAPAEEDKRRRNTAASARFRFKKKMREQSMEKTVREMTEKSSGLENRVKELELEIKWLRGLLIEKGTTAPPTMKYDATTTTSSEDTKPTTEEESEVKSIKTEL